MKRSEAKPGLESLRQAKWGRQRAGSPLTPQLCASVASCVMRTFSFSLDWNVFKPLSGSAVKFKCLRWIYPVIQIFKGLPALSTYLNVELNMSSVSYWSKSPSWASVALQAAGGCCDSDIPTMSCPPLCIWARRHFTAIFWSKAS